MSGALTSGNISSERLVLDCLERIRTLDESVGAFLHVDEASILAQARASDQRRLQGATLSTLDGVPVALKDVIAVAGEPLTCASRILENYKSPYDAHVTKLLKAAGVVLCGRLNMDEFAMGSATENSAFKRTANPWNLKHSPGGSSGGSAAAVAAGMVPMSLGSDTGGSIRQPAAFCGVVGIKPSYGRVSRFGLAAYASSLDQIGPLARTVRDAAALLQIIAGADPKDSTCMRRDVPDYLAETMRDPGCLRIGLPAEFFAEGLDAEVRKSVLEAADFFAKQGHEIVDIQLPLTKLAVPVYYIIATAEATSNLARYDGIRYGHRSDIAVDAIDIYYKSRGEGFGEEVKRRIMLGNFVLSSGYYDAWYVRAQKVRTLLRAEYMNAFDKVDLILTPTTPGAALRQGEHREDPLQSYLEDVYTIPANLAGLPGISLPCGFVASGLPVGLQLLAAPFAEDRLLQVASQYERAHRFAGLRARIGGDEQ
ncbi:MAG: Asp-tRNA(Asn)/Glu-tRNA(Gln) amidotransferase subunit GatA [Verrucomicrobia bacterium]|nr:Asp-tRNA(Asn)/Glu-tRNA(Gln) amidotransferase subunit GatA [Verrucomicrobiota bacterium]